MKRFWKIWFAAVVMISLMAALAQAEESSAPSEEACRHENRISYTNETSHGEKCADCGEVMTDFMHVAVCTAPNKCMDCGAPFSTNDIRHDALVWENDDARHRLVCTSCGTVCADWEEHHALCEDPHVCASCRIRKDFSGSSVLHSLLPWTKADAETHVRSCRTCGDVIVGPENHTRMCDGNLCLVCYGEYTGGNVQHNPGSNGVCTVCGSGSTGGNGDSGSTGDAGDSGSSENNGSSGSNGNNGGSGSSGNTGSSGSSKNPGGSSTSAKKTDPFRSGAATGVQTVAGPAFYEDGLPRAIISAPRSGKASVRETASDNGKVLDRLMDGTVVTVLGESGKYTQVSVEEVTGYVLTTSLEMLDMSQRALGEGVMENRAKGGGRISVRSEPSISALKIAAWPTGTEVVIWSVSDNGQWYEIEHENARVWIHVDYLTVTRAYEYTDEVAAETAEAETEV